MFNTDPPKKYIKDSDGKLVLNPLYKSWKDGESTVDTGHYTNNVAVVAESSSHPDDDDSDIPVSIAVADDDDDDDGKNHLASNFNDSLTIDTSLQEAEYRRLQEENERMKEIERLRKENEQLKQQQQALNNNSRSNSNSPPPLRAPPGTTLYAVTVPSGVRPGQKFKVKLHGLQYQVTCPPNVYPGSTIHVPIPTAASNDNISPGRGRRGRGRSRTPTPPRTTGGQKMYAVKIPHGVIPGQSFQIDVSGRRYMVTCPMNTRPGQTIHVPIAV